MNTFSTYLSSKLDSTLVKTRFSSNQNIGEGESNFDDEYVEKSVQLMFNWSEFHLSEMTFHTLIVKCEMKQKHLVRFEI